MANPAKQQMYSESQIKRHICVCLSDNAIDKVPARWRNSHAPALWPLSSAPSAHTETQTSPLIRCLPKALKVK